MASEGATTAAESTSITVDIKNIMASISIASITTARTGVAKATIMVRGITVHGIIATFAAAGTAMATGPITIPGIARVLIVTITGRPCATITGR